MPILLVTVLAGFVGAPLCLLAARVVGARVGWVSALVPGVVFGLLLSVAGGVIDGEALGWSASWIPSLGLTFSLRLDGLGLLMALLISGIGTLILIFSAEYMREKEGPGRLAATLLLFMGSMLGVVLADNVLTLFVFWELTSVSSYLLIGFDHEREKARKAALQGLLVTGLGGLALLLGLLLLGRAAGSFELSRITAGGLDPQTPLLPAITALILLGCFTKSAQFPFHFWLPSAMEAPTPVSAYLHSSTMVKAGVYLLARLSPTLSGTPAWETALLVFGGSTVVVGTVLALRQTVLKRLLAYSTVSSLGVMVLLLGVGTEAAVVAAIVFLVAHALYKGALFLVAGALTHATGEKDAEKLSGLLSARRGWGIGVVGVGAALAGASMAGIAPMLGFLGKEGAIKVMLGPEIGWPGLVAVMVGSVGTVYVAMMVGVKPFVGRGAARGTGGQSPGFSLVVGALILASMGLVWGLVPGFGAEQLVGAAAQSIRGSRVDVHLHLWEGFTPTLGLSLLAVIAGVAAYVFRGRLRRVLNAIGVATDRVGPDAAYTHLLQGCLAGAAGLTRTLQNERLRWYTGVTVGVAGITVWAAIGAFPMTWPGAGDAGVPLVGCALSVLICTGAVLTGIARSRVTAVIGLGLIGLGIAAIFALFGGPDLAMTQVAADALTIVLLLVAFRRLPDLRSISSRSSKLRDAAIAGVVGLAMAWLTLVASTVQISPPISGYHSANSLPLAYGRNVVNVILVDFRALDTLGEITVVAVAAIGVYTLLITRKPQAMGTHDREVRR